MFYAAIRSKKALSNFDKSQIVITRRLEAFWNGMACGVFMLSCENLWVVVLQKEESTVTNKVLLTETYWCKNEHILYYQVWANRQPIVIQIAESFNQIKEKNAS